MAYMFTLGREINAQEKVSASQTLTQYGFRHMAEGNRQGVEGYVSDSDSCTVQIGRKKVSVSLSLDYGHARELILELYALLPGRVKGESSVEQRFLHALSITDL